MKFSTLRQSTAALGDFMLEWFPRTPGSSEVTHGFEGGYFVTFVGATPPEELVREVINESKRSKELLLKVHYVEGGVQLFWNLTTENILPIRSFALEARTLGEEIFLRTEVRLAA